MMIRRALIAVVAFTISVVGAAAQTKVAKGPIKPTSASNAKQMFDTYCAVCHGKDGKGTGPAATALTKTPADLTRISTRNGGTFPDVRVKRYIEGLDEVPAHGTRDMPMWGSLFRSLNHDTAVLRIQGLSDYLKSLQQ